MKNLKFWIGGVLIAAIVQSSFLGKMIYDRAQHIANGKEVILQSGMVDPRDLFRGHYVTLNLAISEIRSDDVDVIDDVTKRRSDVFVTLKKGEDEFWLPISIQSTLPNDLKTPFIKGSLLSRRSDKSEKIYRIRFPFDRYFAPKKRAQELEKIRNDRKLGIIVSLNEQGEGAVKGISVAGETIYNEPLF